MQALNSPQLSIFETAITSNTPAPVRTLTKPQFSNLLAPLEHALSEVFTQNEENTIIKMRRTLGKTAKDMSDEQVLCITTEFQFLINTWLDEFEIDVFNGMTLKEVLNEG